ncbi:hypothetical protein ABIC89_002555 [Variovorax boronicumulans]|uniref:hypothetical protein n=1 Tax=Variovorax boronicumulans TaxID=436515 RepID=UPI0033993F2F
MPNDAFSTTPMQPLPFGAGIFQMMMDLQMAAAKSAWLAQRQQWETMASWQHSVAAMQRELTDQWICRFGGGVPLDG